LACRRVGFFLGGAGKQLALVKWDALVKSAAMERAVLFEKEDEEYRQGDFVFCRAEEGLPYIGTRVHPIARPQRASFLFSSKPLEPCVAYC